MYSLIKPLLFRLDPERAHDVVMSVLAALSGSSMAMRAMRVHRPPAGREPVSFMGLAPVAPYGLAAGLDKDGRAFPALGALGFGWVEIGTVTPRPQPGNDKPRLFRLPRERALINRMGFNSRGVDALTHSVAARRGHYDAILGINIGKNARTPLNRAADDYVEALRAVHPLADYVAINVSSPNTASLRELQHIDHLRSLLRALSKERDELEASSGRRVPIAVKLSPDLPEAELHPVCDVMREAGVDGVIATNTTTSRPPGLAGPGRDEAGGLSGPPMEPIATRMVAALHGTLGGDLPIIGVGGIEDAATATRKLSAGAVAVQCYTAFIYQGPRLIRHLSAPEAR